MYLAYLAYRCSVASLRASDVPCELWSPEWAGGNGWNESEWWAEKGDGGNAELSSSVLGWDTRGREHGARARDRRAGRRPRQGHGETASRGVAGFCWDGEREEAEEQVVQEALRG